MMKGITKAAKVQDGSSYRCEKCVIKKICTLEIHQACSDSFIEGFRKGARFAANEHKKTTD